MISGMKKHLIQRTGEKSRMGEERYCVTGCVLNYRDYTLWGTLSNFQCEIKALRRTFRGIKIAGFSCTGYAKYTLENLKNTGFKIDP